MFDTKRVRLEDQVVFFQRTLLLQHDTGLPMSLDVRLVLLLFFPLPEPGHLWATVEKTHFCGTGRDRLPLTPTEEYRRTLGELASAEVKDWASVGENPSLEASWFESPRRSYYAEGRILIFFFGAFTGSEVQNQ